METVITKLNSGTLVNVIPKNNDMSPIYDLIISAVKVLYFA